METRLMMQAAANPNWQNRPQWDSQASTDGTAAGQQAVQILREQLLATRATLRDDWLPKRAQLLQILRPALKRADRSYKIAKSLKVCGSMVRFGGGLAATVGFATFDESGDDSRQMSLINVGTATAVACSAGVSICNFGNKLLKIRVARQLRRKLSDAMETQKKITYNLFQAIRSAVEQIHGLNNYEVSKKINDLLDAARKKLQKQKREALNASAIASRNQALNMARRKFNELEAIDNCARPRGRGKSGDRAVFMQAAPQGDLIELEVDIEQALDLLVVLMITDSAGKAVARASKCLCCEGICCLFKTGSKIGVNALRIVYAKTVKQLFRFLKNTFQQTFMLSIPSVLGNISDSFQFLKNCIELYQVNKKVLPLKVDLSASLSLLMDTLEKKEFAAMSMP